MKSIKLLFQTNKKLALLVVSCITVSLIITGVSVVIVLSSSNKSPQPNNTNEVESEKDTVNIEENKPSIEDTPNENNSPNNTNTSNDNNTHSTSNNSNSNNNIPTNSNNNSVNNSNNSGGNTSTNTPSNNNTNSNNNNNSNNNTSTSGNNSTGDSNNNNSTPENTNSPSDNGNTDEDKNSFICDDVKNEKILYLRYDSSNPDVKNYMMLANGNIYEINTGSVKYSNNQNCKKVVFTDEHHSFLSYNNPKLMYGVPLLQMKDNSGFYKLINIEAGYGNLYTDKRTSNYLMEAVRDNSIVNIVKNTISNNVISLYFIKTDGSLYKRKYLYTENEEPVFQNEELVISSGKYGKIINVSLSTSDSKLLYTDSKRRKNIRVYDTKGLEDSKLINYLITENDIILSEEIKTPECNYADVVCDRKLVAKNLNLKYHNIKYLDRYLLVLDNKIVRETF